MILNYYFVLNIQLRRCSYIVLVDKSGLLTTAGSITVNLSPITAGLIGF